MTNDILTPNEDMEQLTATKRTIRLTVTVSVSLAVVCLLVVVGLIPLLAPSFTDGVSGRSLLLVAYILFLGVMMIVSIRRIVLSIFSYMDVNQLKTEFALFASELRTLIILEESQEEKE